MEMQESIRSMSNEQLADLQKAIIAEIAYRDRIAKEQDWAVVQNAIINFTSKWGSISVTDKEYIIDITKGSDFDTVGAIDTVIW